jgi:hypothetical protein
MSHALDGLTIGISISDSPDLAELGLSKLHLEDAMIQVARQLLGAGASLVYGGDLREGGFTNLLFEFVAMYRKPKAKTVRPRVVDVLAWPLHTAMKREDLAAKLRALESIGEVTFLGPNGKPMPRERALALQQREPAPSQWRKGLTTMREHLTRMCDARVAIGGQVTNFKGVMPGIAEECLLSIKARKPTFLVGGFGGCAGDIVATMRNTSSPAKRNTEWTARERFRSIRLADLRDGLKPDESLRLATTRHVDEIVTLLLRGLERRPRSSPAKRK